MSVIIKRMEQRDPKTLFINNFTSFSELFSLYSDRTGTKAWLKAPSANIRLKTLGILVITT